MNEVQPSPTVSVTLRESTVAMLMELRSGDETLDTITARCADLARRGTPFTEPPASALEPPTPAEITPPVVAVTSTWSTSPTGARVASVLGMPIGAPTLGKLLRNVVDAMHDLDPSVIEWLSEMKARKRRYVARKPEQVHAGRRDLPVLQTRSGWWVSGNIGEDDFIRSLKALCRASGLHYGQDIRFPA